MKLSEGDLQSLHQEATARRGATSPECPSQDVLLEAASGRSSATARAGLAAHMAACADCAREYRIARSLRPLEEEAQRAFRRPATILWPAAAAVLLTLLTASIVWSFGAQRRASVTIAELRQTLDRQRAQPLVPAPAMTSTDAAPLVPAATSTDASAEPVAPEAGTPIVDIDAEPVRGGDGTPAVVPLPAGTDLFTLILHLAEIPKEPVVIEVRQREKQVWSGRVRADAATSTVTLTLHRTMFPFGDYMIRARHGSSESRFPFRVRSAAP